MDESIDSSFILHQHRTAVIMTSGIQVILLQASNDWYLWSYPLFQVYDGYLTLIDSMNSTPCVSLDAQIQFFMNGYKRGMKRIKVKISIQIIVKVKEFISPDVLFRSFRCSMFVRWDTRFITVRIGEVQPTFYHLTHDRLVTSRAAVTCQLPQILVRW